ncbi:FomA family porin-like outer membrane protein [Cetobacterium somerae]|uniref:FomA family porin-like outer membrane protein n=1 Tax=Cetobacterium somerae TaxID=188913 RepID=UPI003D766776
MKKLALFLGSLLVVGTAVQAKEIVAPVEVSKEVVVVAEPVVEEVIVTPAFKPTGYIGVEFRGYGKTEGHGDKQQGYDNANGTVDPNVSQDEWNRGRNNYSRLETTFGVQATENFSFEGRIRDFNSLEKNDDSYVNKKDGTETRLRAYYQHNEWFTSRVEYFDEVDNTQSLEYQARFTVYQNKGALLSKLLLAPKFYHSFPSNGGSDYTNTLGMDIEYAGNLPLGFTWDGTIYLNQNFYGQDYYTGVDKATNTLTGSKDKEFTVNWELYLYRTFALYTTDNYGIDLNFEGGYDPYVFGQYDRYTKNDNDVVSKSDKDNYSLYAKFTLDGVYNVTESFSVNAGVGAEYRNWDNINQNSASDWRWQPFAFVGMKTVF